MTPNYAGLTYLQLVNNQNEKMKELFTNETDIKEVKELLKKVESLDPYNDIHKFNYEVRYCIHAIDDLALEIKNQNSHFSLDMALDQIRC